MRRQAVGCVLMLCAMALAALYSSGSQIRAQGVSPRALAIAAGDDHFCVITSSNTVQCWGRNDVGQLGDGTQTNRALPVVVSGIPDTPVSIRAGGNTTCVLTSGNAVYCWGSNSRGQAGQASVNFSTTPVRVNGFSNAPVVLTVGAKHACVIQLDRTVMCWGSNESGQINAAPAVSNPTPVRIPPNALWADGVPIGIAAGNAHTCILISPGRIICYGSNGVGQFGNGAVFDFPSNGETLIPSTAEYFLTVHAGGAFNCTLARERSTQTQVSSEAVYCWGVNDHNQTATFPLVSNLVLTPTRVSEGTSIFDSRPFTATVLSAGERHACAALPARNGTYCWGSNLYGQLGIDMASAGPYPAATRVVTIGLALDVAVSDTASCAIVARPDASTAVQNAVACWGRNDYGQLGVGFNVPQSRSPVFVNLRADPPTPTPTHTPTATPQGDVGKSRTHLPAAQRDASGEWEPNNSSAQAVRLYSGLPRSGALNDTYDVFLLDMQAGALSVRLEGVPVASQRGVQLQVYAASGTGGIGNLLDRRFTPPFDLTLPGRPAGRIFIVVFTDAAFQRPDAPYVITAAYP